MADESSLSALENEQEPLTKHKNQEKCEESTNGDDDEEEAASPLTNTCNELIDRIFDFLDMGSLFSVAHTCKQLQNAAAAKLGLKLGNGCVKLIKDYVEVEVLMYSNLIHVRSLKNCLKFLRCFGAIITNLKVYGIDKIANESDKYVDQYIHQYCSDTLATLEFSYREFLVDSFKEEKFENVTALCINHCDLRKHLSNFAKSFPNLRQLDIGYGVEIIDEFGSNAEVSFPHLDQLSVVLDKSLGGFNANCVHTLLHANPQLKNLDINLRFGESFSELLKILGENPFLSKLKILGKVNGVNASALNQFMKKHPLLEELELSNDNISVDDAVILCRELDSLKSLKFQFRHPYECDNLLIKLDSHWQHSVSHGKYHSEIILRH